MGDRPGRMEENGKTLRQFNIKHASSQERKAVICNRGQTGTLSNKPEFFLKVQQMYSQYNLKIHFTWPNSSESFCI